MSSILLLLAKLYPPCFFIDLQFLNCEVSFPDCQKRSGQANARSELSVSVNIRESSHH